MHTVYFYIPIRNLGWVYSSLVLDGQRKIRFIEELDNETEKLQKLGLIDAHRGWYKSCLILKQVSRENDTGFEYIQEIYKTIAFFRLFLNAKISFEKVYLLGQVVGQKQESFIQKSNLSKKEKELLERWRKFSKAYETRPNVFHWYSRVQEDLPPNERIVFLCVSLEGLLLKEENQELRYKFSLRGAYLLGKKAEDRIKLKKFFQQVYDFRSAIVHCDKKQELKLIQEVGSISRFTATVDIYTARLLKLFIKDYILFDRIDKFITKGEAVII